MCLIVKKPSSLKGQQTFYKVYVHDRNPTYVTEDSCSPYIHSPFHCGSFAKAGTIEVPLPTSATAEPFKGGYAVPINDLVRLCKGKLIDIAGLHCIATKEEAQLFGEYVVEDYVSFSRRHPYKTVLILPVVVEASDIIVRGETNLKDDRQTNKILLFFKRLFVKNSVETYVVRRLTIADETYKKALLCAPELKLQVKNS